MLMPWTKNKLEKDLQKIRLLPSGMRERGEILLRKPRAGRKYLGKIDEQKLYSNCWGTTVFLEGEGAFNQCKEIATGMPPHHGYIPSVYWKDRSRPGLVEINVMEKFLGMNYDRIDNPSPGDVVVVESFDMGVIYLAHTGIWTGVDDYVLEQHNLGENFGFQNFFVGQNKHPFFNYSFARKK